MDLDNIVEFCKSTMVKQHVIPLYDAPDECTQYVDFPRVDLLLCIVLMTYLVTPIDYFDGI